MNLELNCASLTDEGKGISIPPEHAKKYPTKIGVKDIKEYIDKGGEVAVDIPLEDAKKKESTQLEQSELGE